ncbi:MAG TPA: hypothetical protein VN577_19250 [Terriglobales bacterium]|nr:hypothetical protein [Terriglobales bacterium]
MRRATCATCATEQPIGQMNEFAGKIYCPTCASNAAEAAKQGEIHSIIDPTICANCSTDWGSSELPKVGGLPFCPTCREKVYNYPFPNWLKAGLALALVLLVVALANGAKYFRLGKNLYRGESQLKARNYPEAIRLLTPVAEAAPECEKCVLLLAKSYLLAGQPEQAWAAAKKHHDGQFDNSELFDEVKPLFDRFMTAFEEVESAQKKYIEEHNEEEAMQLLDKAIKDYPEWQVPREQKKVFEVGLAFDHKDYDKFLSLAQESYRTKPDSMSTAQVASALACKYAVTGEPQFRTDAEQMLAKARDLATDDTQTTEYQEYYERIMHRLDSREIISREEYNRKYRPNQKQEGK